MCIEKNVLANSWRLTVNVEWEFMQGLQYKEQTAEDSEFIRLIYMSRLRKYKHAEEHALCRRRLVEEFGLSDNPDVLFSFADALYTQARYADCYVVTQRLVCRIFFVVVSELSDRVTQDFITNPYSRADNATTHWVYVPPSPPKL